MSAKKHVSAASDPSAKPPRRLFDFAEYLRTETIGGLFLLGAAVVALVLANSPLSEYYIAVRDYTFGPEVLHLNLSVAEWAKDGLLAVFFLVAGLELKRELVIGELNNRKSAALPVIAALGGMIVPAVLALIVGWGAPGIAEAWAIPVATDIAFALGVLSLTGSGMPASARVFLLSLAVVDDLGAILLIAVLFTKGLSLLALLASVLIAGVYWFGQHKRVRTLWLYIPLGIALWVAVHSSGLHATIAGVALGLLTRVKADEGEHEAPAVKLEHRLQPWSAGLVVPVFALFAAGVPMAAEDIGAMVGDRVAIAVFVGLVLGKVLGIFGASFLAVKCGVAQAPTGLQWRDIAGLSMLGGVGFTVSLLITELSLVGDAAERAKAAVLIASAVASILGALFMWRTRVRRNKYEAAAQE